jgi:spore coat polysaccharide biosynthesis protein SpsF
VKLGIVILSRYNSSRLPGKALMQLNNKPTLAYIIERLNRVVPQTDIVLATSEEASDDPIAEFAAQNNINCFRGSLDNVADRFYKAALTQGWDYAVRINGDNIFVDTDVLTGMINIVQTGDYDFVSNVKGRTFPKGMSVEIISLKYYASLLPQINASAAYREHVTLCIYDQDPERHFYYLNTTLPEASGIQMALDTSEDMERTKKIISCFTQEHWRYNMKEIFTIWNLIENEPSI